MHTGKLVSVNKLGIVPKIGYVFSPELTTDPSALVNNVGGLSVLAAEVSWRCGIASLTVDASSIWRSLLNNLTPTMLFIYLASLLPVSNPLGGHCGACFLDGGHKNLTYKGKNGR